MAFKAETACYQRIEAHEELFHTIRLEVAAFMQANKNKHQLWLLVKFCVYAPLLTMAYLFIFRVQSFACLLLLYTGMGYLLVFLGLNFAHDFAHNTLFKSSRLNNGCFEALFLLMGINGYLWKKRHIHSHHVHPNMEGYDVDIELSGIIRFSNEQPAKGYHLFQPIYAPLLYLTYTLYWIGYKDVFLFFKRKHANLTFDTHPLREWVKLIVFKVLYISYMLLLPALFSSFTWLQILAVFLGMHLMKSGFLLFTFLISHHVENIAYHGHSPLYSSWFMHQIRSANDFHPFSSTANFIFGGFNCHVAHHLFPSVPHPYYPEISRIIYRNLAKNSIPVHQTSYLGGIVSHITLLKLVSSQLSLKPSR
jgi:linoleoyl-CoA desaturase